MINMKKAAILMGLMGFCFTVIAQKYMTQSATIKFFSETPIENIDAVNNQVASVLDAKSGELAFSLLIRAFAFEKALMQEHFNEKYMESDKYPKSTFKGKIENFQIEDLTKEFSEYKVKGELSIHGISKEIEVTAQIKKDGKNIIAHSVFTVDVADYEIKIPATVRENISKTIELTVDAEYELVK